MDEQRQKTAADSPMMSRREFIAGAGSAALSMTLLRSRGFAGIQEKPKLKIGIIGCGGRGTWVADHFLKHGGFEISAAADYFQERLDAFGAKFSVSESRLFAGLGGYKRLLGSGVDAVAVESPPYFHPEQAAAAVEAGVHVYIAKPVAVDVPGCNLISESACKASQKKLVFLVDFQTRAHPAFIEALRRIHEGALGDIVFGEATYHADCPFEQWYELLKNDSQNPENRLRGWGLDFALSGDIITEQEIHALDVMSWVMGEPPLFAVGTGGLTARPKIGTCWDHYVVYYQYAKDVAVQFSGKQFKGHGTPEGIKNRMFGTKGVVETQYGGNVLIRGENYFNGGSTAMIYEDGVVNNITAFYEAVTKGDAGNATVPPSVQSNLVTILGRKAARENRMVTWEETLKDQEKLDPDVKGLKG